MKIQPPASLIPATRFLPVHPKVQHQVSTRKEPAYPRSARERWQVLRLPLPQPARSLRAVARLWLPVPPRAAPIPRRDPAANAPGRSVPIRHQWPHSISWRTLKRPPCHCCLCRRRLIHFHCTPNTKIMPIQTRHFDSCKKRMVVLPTPEFGNDCSRNSSYPLPKTIRRRPTYCQIRLLWRA